MDTQTAAYLERRAADRAAGLPARIESMTAVITFRRESGSTYTDTFRLPVTTPEAAAAFIAATPPKRLSAIAVTGATIGEIRYRPEYTPVRLVPPEIADEARRIVRSYDGHECYICRGGTADCSAIGTRGDMQELIGAFETGDYVDVMDVEITGLSLRS